MGDEFKVLSGCNCVPRAWSTGAGDERLVTWPNKPLDAGWLRFYGARWAAAKDGILYIYIIIFFYYSFKGSKGRPSNTGNLVSHAVWGLR